MWYKEEDRGAEGNLTGGTLQIIGNISAMRTQSNHRPAFTLNIATCSMNGMEATSSERV